MPLAATIDLLDRALLALTDPSLEITREELASAAAAVGRLVAAVDVLIREAETADSAFESFLGEHPELREVGLDDIGVG